MQTHSHMPSARLRVGEWESGPGLLVPTIHPFSPRLGPLQRSFTDTRGVANGISKNKRYSKYDQIKLLRVSKACITIREHFRKGIHQSNVGLTGRPDQSASSYLIAFTHGSVLTLVGPITHFYWRRGGADGCCWCGEVCWICYQDSIKRITWLSLACAIKCSFCLHVMLV